MSNTALGAALTIDDSVLAKIQEAENRIIRLEQTTRTSADKIAKSFRSMGDLGVQYFIDKLKIAQTELSKVSSLSLGGNANVFANLGQQATAAASNITQMVTAMNQYAVSIDRVKIANAQNKLEERTSLNEIKEAMNKQLEIMRQLNQANRENALAAKKAANETKVQSAQATRDTQARVSAIRNETQQIKAGEAAYRNYSRAMLMSEQTITSRTKKIEQLKAVIAQLSKEEAKYTNELNLARQKMQSLVNENKKYENSVKSINTSHRNLMNTSDQLARKLALIFSVSQIQGYVNKLIQVRGEFELQNTALASILQNKDQADKLFGQITELAVQSPFTVKELTTYTKSLAAYQFQYEELYDTTKRLADVASGLGVDMQRLILAVGQVKAAGYLRGTETRQFTEAGFNILGELAKYYSELEGRIVSVGEVQERQFKRMIAFQDVEEVFRRVTDAGGMFYQMQERQAETLAGQMSNLKDSIDLMFNSIGEQNDGTLKDMVALVRSFVENWQEVVFVLKPAVTALGAWKTLTLLASIGNKQFALSLYAIATNAKTATASISLMTRATTALAAVGRGLMSVFAIAIPIALIAGVMELYRVTTKASREANELKKALDGISNEGFVRASELISNFKVLAEKAVEAADGSKEQQAALEELQRTYKDILPERDLEIDKLRELKGEYDNVTTAIYSKIEAQIKEKQIQEVSNTYGTAASEAMDALAKRLTDYNISLSTAKTITNEFKKMLEQGMIKDANQAKTELENLIRLFSGQYASLGEQNIWQKLGWTTGVDVLDEIDDAFNAFTRFNDEVKRLEGEPITPFRIGGGTEMYQSLKEELENIAKFKDDWEKQNKDKFKFKVEFSEESKNALISQYQKFIADLNSKISSGQIKQGDILSANLIIEEAQKAIEKLDVSPQIAQVNDLRVEFSKLYDIDFEKFSFTKMLEGQGFNDFIKRLDEGIKGYQEIIDVFDQAAKQGTEVPAMQQWALLQGKTIEEIRTLVPVLEEYRAKLALVTKEEDKRGGKDTTSQTFKNQLSFLQRANSEYEKLLKNYSAEQAKLQVINAMKAEAAELGVSDIFLKADFDDSGILAAIELLKTKFASLSPEMATALAKAISTIQIDMDVELREGRIKTIQDQFSELFGSYELSLELENLGLDKEVASKLFNLDILDLSELKKKAETYKDELLNILGDDGVSAWEEINRRITEAEEKELEKRLKTFAEYLKKTVNETKKIQTQVGKDISFAKLLFSENKIDASQYVEIISQIQKKANEELSKIAVDKFKESPEYIKAMGDMSIYTKKELERLSQQLQRLISESASFSDASDLKVYQDALEKVNEQINKIQNPFNESFIGEIQRIKELQEEYNLELERYNELLRERDLKTASLKDAENQLALLQEKRQNGDNSLSLLGQIQNAQKGVQVATQGLNNVNNQLNISQGNLSNISSSMGDIMQGASGIIGMIDKIVEGVYQSINATIELFNEIKDLASSFGAEVDEGAWSDLTIALEALGETNEKVMGAWESFKSGDLLGAVTKSVGAIFSVIKGINSLLDNKKEKEIKKQIEEIEKLQKAYEKLEEAIDNAFSIDTLQDSTEQAIANLEATNAAAQKALAAEMSKKDRKQDKERIEELQDIIEANNEAIQDLIENQIEALGGLGSVENMKSAAQEFIDAWYDAYKETGDGLAGLNEQFDEFVDNTLKKQLMLRAAEKYLEGFFKEFDKMFEDGVVTGEEMSNIGDLWDNVSAGFDTFLTGLAEELGVQIGETTEKEVSDIIENMQSTAEQFVQAWMDAYRETGKGLEALEEQWDEYIIGVIQKQMMLQGLQKYLEPVFKMLDSMLADEVFSPDEADKIQAEIDKILPQLNTFWETIANSFKIPSNTQAEEEAKQEEEEKLEEFRKNLEATAESFANTWLQAYKETGDGLSALEDKWDEYFENIVAKQLMMKGMDKFLEPLMKMMDSMLEDSVLSPEEAAIIQEQANNILPQLDELWKMIAESFKIPSNVQGQEDAKQEIEDFNNEVQSTAESFADAWLQAYKETGDGLEVLGEQFDQYIENIIKKQMALRATEKFIEPIMKQVEEMLEDNIFSEEENKIIQEKIDAIIPQLNEFWKQIAEGFEIPVQPDTTEEDKEVDFMEEVKNSAQEFADAWMEAYKATGDGLDALNEKWDEYIENIIRNQLRLRRLDNYLEPIFRMIDNMTSDNVFTPKEAAMVQEQINKLMPELNEFWKAIADSFGISGGMADNMTGLQKGISSITEETAQALEALLNSMRYFVSDSNLQLRNILATLTAPAPENPFLLELKAQTEQLRTMNSLWSRIVKSENGSIALNVRIK